MAEGARLESVCGGNSTAGSNPALSAIVVRAPDGVWALRIAALRTVSGPEGSSPKGTTASAAGHLGSIRGSIAGTATAPGSASASGTAAGPGAASFTTERGVSTVPDPVTGPR